MNKLPYGRQSISDKDIEAVVNVLKSDWLTTGPIVEKFEQILSNTTNANYAVSCSSGTAALHLAVLSLGIGAGDQVIVPSLGFVAIANAVRLTGADVVFADVDSQNGMITLETLKHAYETSLYPDKICAVIVLHLNGQSAKMDDIKEYSDKHNWRIIEDACHVIGGTQPFQNKEIAIGGCVYSDIAIFSFHPVKTITTAEGGALLTNNADIAEKAKMYRNHGITRNIEKYQNKDILENVPPWYYEQQLLGLNYRLTDMQCALGISQLDQLCYFVQRRDELYSCYEEAFSSFGTNFKLIKKTSWGNPAWHLCSLLIDFNKIQKSKSELMIELMEQGITTQVHYIPIYQQPYYQKLYSQPPLKGCERYYEQQLSLPLYPAMEMEDVKFVVEALVQSVS